MQACLRSTAQNFILLNTEHLYAINYYFYIKNRELKIFVSRAYQKPFSLLFLPQKLLDAIKMFLPK